MVLSQVVSVPTPGRKVIILNFYLSYLYLQVYVGVVVCAATFQTVKAFVPQNRML